MRRLQSEIAQELTWCLIEKTKNDSESDVVEQAATDECGWAISGTRVLRVSHGRDVLAPIFLIMKPDEPVILQVVINRENCHQRDWLGGHRRQQHNPMHRNRRRQ